MKKGVSETMALIILALIVIFIIAFGSDIIEGIGLGVLWIFGLACFVLPGLLIFEYVNSQYYVEAFRSIRPDEEIKKYVWAFLISLAIYVVSYLVLLVARRDMINSDRLGFSVTPHVITGISFGIWKLYIWLV